jgi:hypothetical protein
MTTANPEVSLDERYQFVHDLLVGPDLLTAEGVEMIVRHLCGPSPEFSLILRGLLSVDGGRFLTEGGYDAVTQFMFHTEAGESYRWILDL